MFLASLKIRLNDVYLFSCASGKQLMQSWLKEMIDWPFSRHF